ncbi:MAG: hypothetical protein V1778_04165, partial [bacterium]
VTGTTYTDTGLPAATSYTYQVTAVDRNAPPNESLNKSTAFTATTTDSGSGGSPIFEKTISPGRNTNGDIPAERVPNGTIARSSFTTPVEHPLLSDARPLSTLLGIPTAQAKLGVFSIPTASAHENDTEGNAMRLVVNDGVIAFKTTSGKQMLVGAGGTDISSTDQIILRPSGVTQADGAMFSKTGSSPNWTTSLTLSGPMAASQYCFGSITTNCISSWPTGGGGIVTAADQVVWNQGTNSTYLGQANCTENGAAANCPQPGQFHLLSRGIVDNFIAGPTYQDAGGRNYTVTNAKLFVSGNNQTVGINTITPNAAYKLDVNGDINTSSKYSQNGTPGMSSTVCGAAGNDNDVLTSVTINGGIVTAASCEQDDLSAGGPGGIGGSGAANYLPVFTDATTVGNSRMYQDGGGNVRVIGSSGSATTNNIVFQNTATSNYNAEISLSDSAFQINTTPAKDIKFAVGGAAKVTISSTGSVGIANTSPAYTLDVSGTVNANANLGIARDFINGWSNLIFNTATGSHFAGQQQPADFFITGNGTVGNTLDVGQVLNLPSPVPLTRQNLINGNVGSIQGYDITSRYIFGADATGGGLGFFAGNATGEPVVVIRKTPAAEVDLGYGSKATNLCLFGTGAAVCKNQWPTSPVTNIDQVVWNQSAGTYLGQANCTDEQGPNRPCPQPGQFHLLSRGIVSSFYAGPTYLNGSNYTVTNATLYASGPSGYVGINTLSQSGTNKLNVEGGSYFNGAVSIIGNLAKINNVNYVWPSAQPAANKYLKVTDASGTLTWADVSGGVVAAADQVVWNQSAGTYLGQTNCLENAAAANCPQPGQFHLLSRGIISSFYAGPTYVGGTDYGVTNATLYVSQPSGFVGINTLTQTSGSKLNVNGGSYFGGAIDVITSSTQKGVTVTGSVDNVAVNIKNTGTNGNTWGLYSALAGSGAGAGSLGVYDTNALAYRMVIRNTGKVSVGATDPLAKLHVYDPTPQDVLALQSGTDPAAAGAYTGLILANKNSGTTPWYSSAIRNINTGASPAYLNPRLGFFTQNTDTYLPGNLSERLSILSGGNVGINNTTPAGKLVVNNNRLGNGSTGDAIAAYANSGFSAIYAEQGQAGSVAGYFSVPANGTAGHFDTIGGYAGYFTNTGSSGYTGYFTSNNAAVISGYFSGAPQVAAIQPDQNSIATLKAENTATTGTGVGIIGVGGTTTTASRGSYGIMGFGRNATGGSNRSIGVWGESQAASWGSIRAGVLGYVPATGFTSTINAGVYGSNPDPGGDDVNYAIYSNGDFGTLGNKWGTQQNGNGTAVTVAQTCGHAEGDAERSCQCPEGTFMVGFSLTAGSANAYSIFCTAL